MSLKFDCIAGYQDNLSPAFRKASRVSDSVPELASLIFVYFAHYHKRVHLVLGEVEIDIEGSKGWIVFKKAFASEVKWIVSLVVYEAIFEIIAQSFS